ncbi:hypothetical protein [Myroides odoratus]|uniref:hypothetical protein n=1 Tax=Myroides odoratus TaxID=256 RepID=UPI00333F8231
MGHIAMCPYEGKIFLVLMLSLYIGERFFAFSQGAFLGNASGKRRIYIEKTFRAWATLPCARTGERYFLFFDALLIYIDKRFLPFRKGRFWGINQIKEEYPLKKHFEQGAHGHVPL